MNSSNGVSLLGLNNIQPCDVFNHYTVGRSPKADFLIPKYKPADETLRDFYSWAYAMVSNLHLKIYCTLDPTASSPNDFSVWLEDTSNNGTIVNQSTVLHRGERRLLHSGDEICLVSANSLRRKVRSQTTLAAVLQHFSIVFVRQKNNMPRLSVSPRKAAVNARATTTGRVLPIPHASAALAKSTAGGSSTTTRRLEMDYDVRDLIGEGTAGHVRRAIHRKTGQEKAVKVIQLQPRRARLAHGTPSDLQLVQAEAKILQGLSHPYIVQLEDVYVTQSAVYLVMELLPGGDLFDRIVDKGKYTETESRRVMRRLLAAMHYLHETQNVVHRDLKPENILLVARNDDVQVKLTDFGLAKAVKDDEGCKTFCGTPQYFAPEVLRRQHTVKGRGRYGKPADMWSLGVILYVLLSGTQPDSPRLEFPAEDWRDVSEAAKDLIKCLLRTEPKARLTVQQASEHPWILQPDGDSHVRPLEDPNLKGAGVASAYQDDEAASEESRTNESEAKDDEKRDTNREEEKISADVENNGKSASPSLDTPLPATNTGNTFAAKATEHVQEDGDSPSAPMLSMSKSARVSDESDPRRPLSPTAINTRCATEPRHNHIPHNKRHHVDEADDLEPIGSFDDADESISSFATTEEETKALKAAAAAAATETKAQRKRRRITQSTGDSLARLNDKQQTTLSSWIKTDKTCL